MRAIYFFIFIERRLILHIFMKLNCQFSHKIVGTLDALSMLLAIQSCYNQTLRHCIITRYEVKVSLIKFQSR